MVLDIEGNKIYTGTRVASADNVHGIKLKIGKVVGFTETRVKIDFEGIGVGTKKPTNVVKVFIQEKNNGFQNRN